jgi:hypothetical protein
MVLLNQREGNKALSQNREQDMKTYKEMYEEAAAKTNGEYKGYTKGNALSLYVDEKYGVNAAANNAAHDALCEVASTMSLDDEE